MKFLVAVDVVEDEVMGVGVDVVVDEAVGADLIEILLIMKMQLPATMGILEEGTEHRKMGRLGRLVKDVHMEVLVEVFGGPAVEVLVMVKMQMGNVENARLGGCMIVVVGLAVGK